MGRCLWRAVRVALVLGLVVAACGGDQDGDEGLFTTTSAGSVTTRAGETTTTEVWGVAVDPGAEAMVGGSGVLLREDFQDGDALGWQVEAGWYVLANGQRRMAAAGGEAWAWYADGLGWSRYGVRLAFLAQQGSLGVSVAVGEGGRYVVQVSEDGVFLLRDAPYGSVQALGSAQPVEAGVPHVLAIGVDGGHLQVYADGVLLIDATDGSPLPGGSIGLGAGPGSSVVVDNIVVASLGGPLPQIEAVGVPADSPLPGQLADAAPEAGEALEDGGEPANPDLPNLVMAGVSCPSAVAYGQPFDVLMNVVNTGGADAGPFTVGFYSQGAQVVCEAEVAGLAAGEETVASCEVPGYEEEPDGNGNGDGGDLRSWVAEADSHFVLDEGGQHDDNLVAGSITMSDGEGEDEEPLPNVSLSWFMVLPEGVRVGEPVSVTFQIVQTEPSWQGELTAVGFEAQYEDGNMACRTEVGPPEFSGSCELPAFDAPGEHWLRLFADSSDAIAESNEDDNQQPVAITVLEAGAAPVELPNLYLNYIQHDQAVPEAGQSFVVQIGVWTEPFEVDLSLYTVRLLIDDVVVCSMDVDLSTGEIACDVPGLAAGTHQLEAHIDADNDIVESDETDNDGYGQFSVEE